MALLVADCPRCGAQHITFDVNAQLWRHIEHGWLNTYELFCVCRRCHAATTFVVRDKEIKLARVFAAGTDTLVKHPNALNDFFETKGFVSVRDHVTRKAPDHLPGVVKDAFSEGAACLSIACHNAAGAMFRLCVDLVTKPLLPDPDDATQPQPNKKQRRDLGLRLPWLLDQGLLPSTLRELASCIKEDGNDGAHAGTLEKADAEDLADFATSLLERLITEPEKLRLAEVRRKARRS
jgi:hypothetical protein